MIRSLHLPMRLRRLGTPRANLGAGYRLPSKMSGNSKSLPTARWRSTTMIHEFSLTPVKHYCSWSGQLREGASALSRAVQIDPNLAVARVWLGGANNYLGKYEQGIGELELALRLSPLDPRTFLVYVNLAASHFFAGRYEEAWRWASTGLRSWPHFPRLHWHAMQALAMLGRLDEAAKARERVFQLNPGLTISEFRKSAAYLKEEASEKVAAAWRLAGMPEWAPLSPLDRRPNRCDGRQSPSRSRTGSSIRRFIPSTRQCGSRRGMIR